MVHTVDAAGGSSSDASASELRAPDLACLKAAKALGLVRVQARSAVCPGSIHPDVGWWARANWNSKYADPEKGGPWSVERVHALCERGLVGTETDAVYARLTREGGRVLKQAIQPPKADVLVDVSKGGDLPVFVNEV